MKDKKNQFTKTKYQNMKFKGRKPSKGENITKPTKVDYSDTANDVSWYMRFPEIANPAATFTYGQLMGDPFNVYNEDSLRLAVAGITKIELLPAIGISVDGSSPVNMMERMIYSFIRHANSGSRNYEAPDYMTYLLAMGSAYSFYASLVRLYGILRTYSVTNKYVAQACVEALNFDYENIISSLADLRYYINYYATRLNRLAVPKELNYYQRCLTMPLLLLKDSPLDKCGLYLFDYNQLFLWDPIAETTGSSLQPISWGLLERKTMTDIVDTGEQIINALLKNEDIGLMSGDTLKAFGSDNLFTLKGIDEEFALVPVYDEAMLWQIHNLSTAGQGASSDIRNYKVTQEDGNLIFNPLFTTDSYLPLDVHIMDSPEEFPSVEFNMESTRLHVYRAGENITCCGTEIPIAIKVYSYEVDERGNSYLGNSIAGDLGFAFTAGGLTPTFGPSALIGTLQSIAFDKFPLIYIRIQSEDAGTWTQFYGEINNLTTITARQLTNIHNAALLSLFSVPGAAKAAD